MRPLQAMIRSIESDHFLSRPFALIYFALERQKKNSCRLKLGLFVDLSRATFADLELIAAAFCWPEQTEQKPLKEPETTSGVEFFKVKIT